MDGGDPSMRKNDEAANITVSYDASIGIHARRCVEGLPQVFDCGGSGTGRSATERAKPWVSRDSSG